MAELGKAYTILKLAMLGAVFAGTTMALAQTKPSALTVLGTSTHKRVMTEGKGGDATKGLVDKDGVSLTWVVLENGPIQERLGRELSLPETSLDVAFMLNTQASPNIAPLLEPLDSYQAKDPIEGWDDVFPALAKGMVFDGKLYGIPFRHSTSCLHYNARLFKDAGLAAPTTAEALIKAAIALSKDGVYGFTIQATSYQNIVDVARMWNGDFITADYKLAVTGPGMTKAIETLTDFYSKGVLPKSWATTTGTDITNWMQSGRAAMTISSCGDNQAFNKADASKEAGNIQTVPLPISESLKAQFANAPAKVEFWSMTIPKNSKHKDVAWKFIKDMSSRENTKKAAMNGNGPVRPSTYDTPEIKSALPYADSEKAVLLLGRQPLPSFNGSPKAADIFVEETQAAVLGMKPVQQALNDMEKRIQPLLPK